MHAGHKSFWPLITAKNANQIEDNFPALAVCDSQITELSNYPITKLLFDSGSFAKFRGFASDLRKSLG
jgi:hypothetical protein